MNNRFLQLISTFALILSCGSLRAQDQLKSSGELLREGVTAYDTGNYKQAIALYLQVAEGDTNYSIALHELALAYTADSNYDQALHITRMAMTRPDASKRDLLLQVANIMDNQGKPDSALYYYQAMMQLNPNDHQPLFETGVLYSRQEQLDSAIRYFQLSLMINPFHPRSHQNLGMCYAGQGRLTEAWICLQTAMLYTGELSIARTSINYLDEIGRQTDIISKAYTGRDEKFSHAVFDETDAILHAKLSRSEAYKIKSQLSDEPQAKVTYALLEKLSYTRDDNFVMQYYVPVWLELRDKKLTDAFLLQVYSGYGFENIDKAHSKNKEDIKKVKELLGNYMNYLLCTRTLDYTQRSKSPLKYKLVLNDGIYGEGTMRTPDDFGAGSITFYKHGVLLVKGNYNAEGKRDGSWTFYYPNGNIKSIEQMKDGQITGERLQWYENGLQKSRISYNAQGEVNLEKRYNEFGIMEDEYVLTEPKTYRHDFLYLNGARKGSVLVSERKYVDGTYDNWYENGRVSKHYEVKQRQLEGKTTEFYDNGQTSAVFHYGQDKRHGTYQGFHENGKPSVQCNYKNGKLDGLLERWNAAGQQTSKEEYRDGNLHGTRTFYDEGQAYGTLQYDNGKPVAYEFRDLKGKNIAEGKGQLAALKTYFSNGKLRSDMPLKDGLASGTGKFYYYDGPLKEQAEYLKDSKNGTLVHYYISGQKNFETTYLDNDRNGRYRSYYINGQTYAEGFMLKDQKEGIWRFNNRNGTISSREFYTDNELDGFLEDYNGNGELLSKNLYFGKAMYGLIQYDSTGSASRTTYFKNGTGTYELLFPGSTQASYTCPIVNGRKHGQYHSYYPDGSIRETGFFKYGSRDSVCLEYNIAGVCVCKSYYRKGQKDGKWSYFYDNGKTRFTINYKDNQAEGERLSYTDDTISIRSFLINGDKSGDQVFYGQNMEPALKLIFSQGILMGYTYPGKDGKWLATTPVDSGTAHIVTYYANGKKSADLHYKNSNTDGTQLYYYSNGNLMEERNITNTEYNGILKEYYPDGRLRMSSVYKDDVLHGEYLLYDPSGKLLVSKQFLNGYDHGVCTVTDPKTKAQKKVRYRYGMPVKIL